ncbi:MAG: ATP-dependent DNA helicase RecG [Halobacteriovoraceae bacterium]|jgi:ATP-dependent DNA helicase RecG|nr:ATP-dependent DNA helicase RecG [Halobacteriovoraceae bacterium]
MNWNSSILELAGKRKPAKSLSKLFESGITTLQDLLWIFPLRMQRAPSLTDFSKLKTNQIFLGQGEVISLKFTPAFGKKGKNRVQLFNATCVVKDLHSKTYLNLKWFNTYPNLKTQLSVNQNFTFMGSVSEFNGACQIVNPKINPNLLPADSLLIEYPTLHSISGVHIKNIIDKIPSHVWDSTLIMNHFGMSFNPSDLALNESFKILHGKGKLNKDSLQLARNRLIYQEFFDNQLQILARKLKHKKLTAPLLKIGNQTLSKMMELFPYELTDDQAKVVKHIRSDLKSGVPMMRMVQGDVGCGKTTVALIASLIAIKNNSQVALMCPTEALAIQHAETFIKLLGESVNISLLVGGTKAKDKKNIYERLRQGEIDLIIGTHALIQKNIVFKNLNLAIIDEQHKFGVEQRQKLFKKGDGVHVLIMTATPIPRTLQLTQYGDLDISTIRVMPSGRKGVKTRIVTAKTYEKYLSFVKTRMSLGEQIYIVVPAIEESESLDLKNVNTLMHTYQTYFPEYTIVALHGQLKSSEKQNIMERFSNGNIDLLISTTVIEVGINVLNSSVISIYNPDRFGLSSLHQLRGRVGRGEKTGFCFLITEDNISQDSMKRIKVIENSNDGFEIAQADLQNRGQGDLFGSSQAGHASNYKIANILDDFEVFEKVTQDIEKLKIEQTEKLNNLLLELVEDTKVSTTI